MLIYTIVVTYNGANFIRKCLSSIRESNIFSEVIVIDNNSSDATVSIIEKEFREVNLIVKEKNLGFGKANNLGLRKALAEGADYVFLLNQDAWVEKETIEHLIRASKRYSEFAILSPMHFFNKSSLDFKFQAYYERGKIIKEDLREVEFVNAAIWLIKTQDLVSYGLFNEVFDHYGEDIEFCRRYRSHKKKIGIVTTSIGFHERPQKDKLFEQKVIIRNLEIRILLALVRTEYQFLWGILELFRILFLGNENINRKKNLGALDRIKYFYPTFKKYRSKTLKS